RVHGGRLIVPDETGAHGGAALGEDLRQRSLGQHRLGAVGRQRRHRVLDHGPGEDDGGDARRQPAPEENPARMVVTMAVADRVLVGSLQPDQHDVLSLSGRIGPGWFLKSSLFDAAQYPTIETAAVVDAMHTAMNEVVMVWVVVLSAASAFTRACSAAWRSALAGPWVARPASPVSSIFIPAATRAGELAVMVPVVGTL